MDDSLFVIIRSREKTIFQDKVKAITSFNEKGIFDVLPQHARFISLVKDVVVLHKQDGDDDMKIEGGGVLHVNDNHVNVYIGVFPPPAPSQPQKQSSP